MGLFSNIFGSGGSDKADKLRQDALDAFNAIKTPELSALQVQLDKYVQAGQLTPEQAEASLLSSNAFNSIVTDPSYVGAQKQALEQLQQIGSQGGLTAIDKAQLQDITNQQNQEAQSRNKSIMSQAQEQGRGNSDLTTVNQLINEQGAADRASQTGTSVAAQAQQRALSAMQAAGAQGGQLEDEQYGEQAQKAAAQNAIDLFNKQTLNQTNLYNTQTANGAQAANLSDAQAVNNANTATDNSNKEYNAQEVQQQYQDALDKAKGESGIYQDWAGSAQKQAQDERNASAGLVQGALQGGATALGAAFGGPVGAAAANSMTANGAKPNSNINESDLPGYAEGGEVCGYCQGGVCMEHGGKVPGTPKVPHNSSHNDTVKATLSPGEVVVPLDAQNDDKEFDAFMKKFRPSNRHKMAAGGMVAPSIPRVNNKNPMRDTVKAPPMTNPVPLAATNDAGEFNQFMHKFQPTKKVEAPHIPLEAKAMANLHKRLSDLEGK